MRLFQNSGLYPTYLKRLNELASSASNFDERIAIFKNDRFGASHFLLPILQNESTAFLTNGNDEVLQRSWARAFGMPSTSTPSAILLAQIEEHRTEVFYNIDPIRFQSDFIRKLPGVVRKSIAWRAAPSPGADFSAYDLIVGNFEGILQRYRSSGWKTAYFFPAHDPLLDSYACNGERPIDVLFAGGYSRHHGRRAQVLEAVAALNGKYRVELYLDDSRLTSLAESPVGRLLPLARHRRPPAIRKAALPPIFGRDLYVALSRSKIVVNGAIDMAGEERGNMRCFEAMGCNCLLLSDCGRYPEGMVPGETMVTYQQPSDAGGLIRRLLQDDAQREAIRHAGYTAVREIYSKEAQWSRFLEIVH